MMQRAFGNGTRAWVARALACAVSTGAAAGVVHGQDPAPPSLQAVMNPAHGTTTLWSGPGDSGFLHDAFAARSVSLWFRARDPAAEQVLFDEGGAGSGLALRVRRGRLEAVARHEGNEVRTSAPLGADGGWRHAVAVFDQGIFQLYLDTAAVGHATAPFATVGTHGDPGAVGGRKGTDAFGGQGGGGRFTGRLDDVRIYTAALGPEEVARLYVRRGEVPGSEVRIRVDPARASEWTVDRRILGRFFEHNGRDAYPGLFAQHLGNGSFEDWYTTRRGRRTAELYPTERHPGIAFLWEPVWQGHGPVFWDRLDGGPNGESYQRITIGAPGSTGIRQRVALPDTRTLGYDLSLWARGVGIAALTATLRDSSGTAVARQKIALGPEWERHAVRLTLPSATPDRFRSSPFGRYLLELTAARPAGGAPFLELDGVMLVSGDAIHGKYNPTTLRWVRDFRVQAIRWPGGNWASAYHWEDGVGPVEQRPIRPNVAWGGLEPNYLGTNEFLEWARLAGVDPLINVAFNREVPPEEAARWVEYVNGDTSTVMGRLRARHGHPEPWNVRLWQVGNESYGTYQIGHVPAPEYARRIRDYVDAMRAADPTITVIVAGVDPGYIDWQPSHWNHALLEIAGDRLDAIDIHRYVNGIRNPAEREAEWEPLEYLQTFMVFPTQFERLLEELRTDARERGVPDLEISVGEWNGNPRVSEGWPSMGYPTMAHAAFVAGMYNAFIRQGDAVRYAYQRDNTLWFRPYPNDFRPVNPGAHTLRLYADVLATGEFHHVPLDVGGPTLDTRGAGRRVRPMRDVAYVDASAVRSAAGDHVVLFVTNRDLARAHTVQVRLAPGWRVSGTPEALLQWSEDPFARQESWARPNTFRIEEASLERAGDGSLRFVLPAASVLRLRVPVRVTLSPE